MHKDLSADNTPIGWIKMYLGPDLMFQKLPITVLSAKIKATRRMEVQRSKDVPSMKASCAQQRLDCWYGAQPDLVGFLDFLHVVIGRTLYRLQLLLQLQSFATMGVSFLFQKLDSLWQLTFFLLGLDKASSTCLSSANRTSRFADRSEIFCFSASPEDFRVPVFLCFSSVESFSFIISSESRVWAALSARRRVALWYCSWRLSRCAAWKGLPRHRQESGLWGSWTEPWPGQSHRPVEPCLDGGEPTVLPAWPWSLPMRSRLPGRNSLPRLRPRRYQ